MKRVFLNDIKEWDGKEVLSVIGPTGCGKTGTVLRNVRTRFGANLKTPLIISVDSVAVYRGLDIGSAKPSIEERSLYDWRGLDLYQPTEKVTAMEFASKIEPMILQAQSDQRPVILVGGSHFYERVLVEGPSVGQASDPEFQTSLNQLANEELWGRLITIDTRWTQKVHANDRYRLTRFLDLAERQGFTYDELFSPTKVSSRREGLWPHTATIVLGLGLEPLEHKKRLHDRINKMMALGWFTEVKNLIDGGLDPLAPGLQTVGYREVVQCLLDRMDASELEERILTSHLQLAKKQRTWLRGMLNRSSSQEVMN